MGSLVRQTHKPHTVSPPCPRRDRLSRRTGGPVASTCPRLASLLVRWHAWERWGRGEQPMVGTCGTLSCCGRDDLQDVSLAGLVATATPAASFQLVGEAGVHQESVGVDAVCSRCRVGRMAVPYMLLVLLLSHHNRQSIYPPEPGTKE